MRASSTKSATPVDWYYYLRQNFKPQKLEKALLPKTRAESEKEYIINMVPKSYSSQCIEMRQLESKLEHAGHGYLAQLIRVKMAGALPEDIKKPSAVGSACSGHGY